MYDYSQQIAAFLTEKVKLSQAFQEKLYAHRKANRDRLISRLPDYIPDLTLSETSFYPQGSMAMGTIIQTRFKDEEYDIDDGLVLKKSQLKDKQGLELSCVTIKEKLREALKDDRFKRQPKIAKNAVRVFYADTDEEKHHVDIPVYRIFEDENKNEIQEIASETAWKPSNPTQVNAWFSNRVSALNKETACKGTQLRVLVQLFKRFARSRRDWNLPNGMNLTMLVEECQPSYHPRIDEAFYNLLSKLYTRLIMSMEIVNRAHPDQPKLTQTPYDVKVVDLYKKIEEALSHLKVLMEDSCTCKDARTAWDFVFQSDGFFASWDENHGNDDGSPLSTNASVNSKQAYNRSNHGGQYA